MVLEESGIVGFGLTLGSLWWDNSGGDSNFTLPDSYTSGLGKKSTLIKLHGMDFLAGKRKTDSRRGLARHKQWKFPWKRCFSDLGPSSIPNPSLVTEVSSTYYTILTRDSNGNTSSVSPWTALLGHRWHIITQTFRDQQPPPGSSHIVDLIFLNGIDSWSKKWKHTNILNITD